MKTKNKILTIIFSSLIINFTHADFFYFKKINFSNTVEEGVSIGISNISCASWTCYGIKNGEVWSVGANSHGRLARTAPIRDPEWGNTNLRAEKVIAGNTMAYAIQDGNICVTGSNARGALGLGNYTSVEGRWECTENRADELVAGVGFAMKLLDGRLYVVGDSYHGQLGIGLPFGTGGSSTSANMRNVWIDTGHDNVEKIFAGGWHGFFIKNGILWTSGYNTYGQLGLGHTNSVNNWTNTGIEADFVAVGHEHSYYIKNKNLFATGQNNRGELGVSTSPLWYGSLSWVNTGIQADIAFADGRMGAVLLNNELWVTGENSTTFFNFGNTNHNIWFNTEIRADSLELGTGFIYKLLEGKYFVSGQNQNGQLGLGHTDTQFNFTEINLNFD